MRTVESVSARERERLAAKLKAQREKQKHKETLRQVGKEGQTNGVLNGKGKGKMEEGVRLNRKGKGKEKEVVVVVGGECGDESKAKLKQATPPMNQGKRGTNMGVQVKSGETQPESEVEVEPGNKSSSASNDILGAVEVPDEEQGKLSQLEAFATNAADANGTSSTSPDPSGSLSSSSSPSVNGAEYANGQQTQTTLVSALPVRRKPHRFLRVRDFNPYSLKLVEAEAQSQALTIPRSGENGTSNHRNRSNGKGKQHAFASSPSPPPYSYSYPYPIHLSVNLNLQHLNGFASTGYPPPTSLVPGTLSFPDSSTPMNGGGTNNTNIWGKRRIVREPSITPVKGVFKKDIVSWLPYTEVVSEETFEVTDVMMDDCRLLLLKVCFDSLHLLSAPLLLEAFGSLSPLAVSKHHLHRSNQGPGLRRDRTPRMCTDVYPPIASPPSLRGWCSPPLLCSSDCGVASSRIVLLERTNGQTRKCRSTDDVGPGGAAMTGEGQATLKCPSVYTLLEPSTNFEATKDIHNL